MQLADTDLKICSERPDLQIASHVERLTIDFCCRSTWIQAALMALMLKVTLDSLPP
jgi:hypothetical protein